MYSEAQEIAARCFAGSNGDAGLLHYQLAEEIDNVDRMVQNAGGKLRSKQVIVTIIRAWQFNNPGERSYCE